MRKLLLASIVAAMFVAGAPVDAQEDADMETAQGAPSATLGPRALGVEGMPMPENAPLELRQKAKTISQDVVCLCGTCPKRRIGDCECGWARANQIAILNAVMKGMDKDEIVGAYRKAYGDRVLTMLPNEGFARLAWALPYAAAVMMLLAMVWIGAKYARRGEKPAEAAPTPEPDSAAAEALKRELEDLD